MADVWDQCLKHLQNELSSQQFNTWIRPIQTINENNRLRILAPNQFILDQIKEQYLDRIQAIIESVTNNQAPKISLEVGSSQKTPAKTNTSNKNNAIAEQHISHLNKNFIFENFVEGKSNQFARAASRQVAENPGKSNNPLFIYGGVGLGKTHLMHAVGNLMFDYNPECKIAYLSAERFVRDMVKSLQHNTIDKFKRYYRSVNALLIDDIQFLANKDRSQEEFFHTFNALVEDEQQIILTCDRYPKEVEGLEERLKSRFGWGLTVSVEPPDVETRVAILISKAEQMKVFLKDDVAFFIAQNIHSNVRELEGALKRVVANAQFRGQEISADLAKEALRDLLTIQSRLVTIDNIQKVVAEYYKVAVAELLSKNRSRSIARPRQMAMALTKELTNHSLPEIGKKFGKRDHTTVMHACKKVKEWRETDHQIGEDYVNLLRILST